MLKIKAQGLSEALKKAGKMRGQLHDDADKAVEYTAKKVVNLARERAPRRDGFLKNSIQIMRQYTAPLTRVIGSDRPYARRQEYEHKSRRGYFRKSMFDGRKVLREKIADAIKRLGR